MKELFSNRDRKQQPNSRGNRGWCQRCDMWVYDALGTCKRCGHRLHPRRKKVGKRKGCGYVTN